MKYITYIAQYVPRYVISLLMIFASITMVTGNPEAMNGFEQFGLPLWLVGFSSVMLFSGGILLLQWQNKKLQEYAHVGFMIYFMGAFMAHIGVENSFLNGIPALSLLLLMLVSLYVNHLDPKTNGSKK